MNLISFCLAVIAVIMFFASMTVIIEDRRVEAVPVCDVWHLYGWAGPIYPTEKSMRRALK